MVLDKLVFNKARMVDLEEGKLEGFAKETGFQETVFRAACHMLGAHSYSPFPQFLFVHVHSNISTVIACTQHLDCTEG